MLDSELQEVVVPDNITSLNDDFVNLNRFGIVLFYHVSPLHPLIAELLLMHFE